MLKCLGISLISNIERPNSSNIDDITQEGKHEKGTIQSYYNIDKINKLISKTSFKILKIYHRVYEELISKKKSGRRKKSQIWW